MVDTAHICLRRNDIPQGALQLTDLRPNTSQRIFSYDLVGQSGYVIPMNTVQNAAITALVASDPDGAGGNTHLSTANTEYGLRAYLRDRVNVNPGALNRSMTVVEAAATANALLDRMAAGSSLLLTDINTVINANCAGADSDLTGVGAGSKSFGAVSDVLRIMSGDVYRVRANTVVELIAGPVFVSQANRVIAIGTNTANFFPNGAFAVQGDTDFRPSRTLYMTGALRISVGAGILSKLVDANWVWHNPSFYYGGIVIPGRSQALTLASTPANIPTSGAGAAVVVYDQDGNVMV